MASFSAYATNITDVSFTLNATFTGGDASYSRYRYIRITINGLDFGYWESKEEGGASSSFSVDIDAEPDTWYSCEIALYYIFHDEYAPTGLTDSVSVHTQQTPKYSVSAMKSTYSGDGIASVSVSKSEAEAGEYVRFTATLNPGYVFTCWAKVASAPTVYDIVSTNADFWHQISGNTTLYAYADRPQSSVNLYVVENGVWKPAMLEVVDTKNGVKQWCDARLACIDGGEWKM